MGSVMKNFSKRLQSLEHSFFKKMNILSRWRRAIIHFNGHSIKSNMNVFIRIHLLNDRFHMMSEGEFGFGKINREIKIALKHSYKFFLPYIKVYQPQIDYG